MQVRNERPEECSKTAYKPVAKAIAIAPIPTMVKIKAQTKFKELLPFTHGHKKVKIQRIVKVSITTNALKAAFFDKIALPSSSLKPAAKVIVVISVETIKWVSPCFCNSKVYFSLHCLLSFSFFNFLTTFSQAEDLVSGITISKSRWILS